MQRKKFFQILRHRWKVTIYFQLKAEKNYCGTSEKKGRSYFLKGAVHAGAVGKIGNMHGISATP